MKKLSPAPEPSKISVELGFKHTFNFNSVSANIGVTDYRRAEESLDEAVDRVYDYVEAKIVEKLEATKKEVESVYVKSKSAGKG